MSAPFPRIRSALFSQFRMLAFGMSTRQGAAADAPFGFNLGFGIGDNDGRVEEHLLAFLTSLDLSPDEVAFMDQVHEARVADALEPGVYTATDAIVTDRPGLALAVRVADCLPIVLYAPAENVLGAVHAGWRGTAEHLAARTLDHMASTYAVDPAGVFAVIGPSAHVCCYEVDDTVARLFPASVVARSGNGILKLDMPAATIQQLTDAGVPRDHIEIDPLCTICNPSLFHSHRRDGKRSGRMLSVACMLGES